jgi:serine/threonine protein kinase
MLSLLIKKNLPHVVCIENHDGLLEKLSPVDSLNDEDVINVIEGLKELHSADITVMDIRVGRSEEGQVKITDLSTFGWGETPPINTRYNTPETKYVKFKSDIWCLGCFLYSKNIPKRFHKSQELLDTFLKDAPDAIKNMLKINPEERRLPDDVQIDSEKCTIF